MSERSGSEPPGAHRRSLPDRRARERRVLWAGLLASLGLHLLVLGIAGGWLEPDGQSAPSPTEPAFAEPPQGMRVVQLAEPTGAETPDVREPEPEPEPTPQEPEPEVARTEPSTSQPADSLTAADRLAPRVVDPRLWEPMVLVPREPTLAEVEARVGAAVELLSDSALAEAEAALRATDWTVEDADGGRWGISPGKLHLGKLTLPLPIWFAVDPEADAASQEWWLLERQADRARILESFEDRVRAIRERRDREREERRNAEEGGGG